MYDIYTKPSFEKDIKKIKDNQQKENIKKKIQEISKKVENNPNHYKNLHKPLQGYKRVHINKHFVMVFKINEDNRTVTFYCYKHHDSVYK